MGASLPENEPERLRALRQTGLLDSGPDEDFDSIVRLAAIICEMPIALMSLVDANRQWFKANVGLGLSETDRDSSFCAFSILQPGIMEVGDALLDARFAEDLLVTGDPYIRFYAGVPLETCDGFRLGSLCVIDRVPRRLSPVQKEALQLLARQAGKQIDIRTHRHALQEAITAGSRIEEGLRATQELFDAFMDNSPFLGFMKDTEGRMVYYNQRLASEFGIDRNCWLGKTDFELWPGGIGAQLRANDQAVLRDWKTMVFEEHAETAAENARVWRSYKFPYLDPEGKKYVAGLTVDITADKQAEKKILEFQTALEKANEKLLALSMTDSLTSLLNRRAFDEALAREFALVRRYGHPLALIILDIDNFKSFNDNFGHEEGDRVLRCVAGALAAGFRATDVVARYGGEEFAVILPSTGKQSAMETVERVRATIDEADFHTRHITISAGLAMLESPLWSESDLVRLADQALYSAKRGGRNRVCLACP